MPCHAMPCSALSRLSGRLQIERTVVTEQNTRITGKISTDHLYSSHIDVPQLFPEQVIQKRDPRLAHTVPAAAVGFLMCIR